MLQACQRGPGLVFERMCFSAMTGMVLRMMYGLAAGIAGSVAVGVAGGESSYPLHRQIGGAVLGVLVGATALGMTYSVVSGVIFDKGGIALQVGVLIDPRNSAVFGAGVGIYTGVVSGLLFGLRARRWGGGLLVGVLVCLEIGVGYTCLIGAESEVVRRVASGLTGGMGFGAMLILGYILVERIGGVWAGAMAGALVSGMGWVAVEPFAFADRVAFASVLPLCLFAVLAGLLIDRWRPLLLYPFLAARNTLLYYNDKDHPGRRTGHLCSNSAFWDEHQWLHLLGLDEHLLLVMERNPAEGKAAMEYLAAGSQRWAVRTVRVEMEARRLERCSNLEGIRDAYANPVAEVPEGFTGSLLYTFSGISRDVGVALNQTTTYHKRVALSHIEDHLNGLLRELDLSHNRYATRFRVVASHWQQIVASQVLELAASEKRRQEIENPYIVGMPLTERQEVFVGRADVSAEIERLLMTKNGPALLLYGQRRMGKTSLLHNLGRLLPSTVVPLFVDLQGPASHAIDHVGLLLNIARGMIKSAGRQRSLSLPALSREALEVDPFTQFDEWLDEVGEALGPVTALLALDEIEALDAALTEGRFSEAAVLGMLRHIIQHRPHFKILLATSHSLDELRRWAGYLINVQVVHLGYLCESEARQLIERPVKDFPLIYQPEATRRVLALTSGHPALIQLLCREIVVLKNKQHSDVRMFVRPADVEEAIPRVLERGTVFYFHHIAEQVEWNGLAILRFMAARGEGAVVSKQELASQIPVPEELAHTLALLIRRDLIEPVGTGYRFKVQLLRCWFAREERWWRTVSVPE